MEWQGTNKSIVERESEDESRIEFECELECVACKMHSAYEMLKQGQRLRSSRSD
jgi:hypothetical protein